MHNGFIEKARDGLLRKIREALRDEYYRLIRGSTDSEHIFALILNFLHGQEPTPQAYATAIRHTVAQLLDWTRGQAVHMGLNLVLSDGVHVVALRFANTSPAPSLYYVDNGADFSDAVVIASEKLSADPAWKTVPESHIVICRNATDIDLVALGGQEAA
jgi:glutamine amidotransferase